jgi:hypothetical protein
MANDPQLLRAVASSGNLVIDTLCVVEAKRLNKFFGVNALFSFYDDSGFENAQAELKKYATEPDDGRVLMGVNFAHSLIRTSDVAIMVVLAHEWAHIRQFKANTRFVWNVRYELAADKDAGAYLGSTNVDKDLGKKAAKVFSDMGKNDFTNPDYHGTANQRADMFRDGFGVETGISERGPR